VAAVVVGGRPLGGEAGSGAYVYGAHARREKWGEVLCRKTLRCASAGYARRAVRPVGAARGVNQNTRRSGLRQRGRRREMVPPNGGERVKVTVRRAAQSEPGGTRAKCIQNNSTRTKSVGARARAYGAAQRGVRCSASYVGKCAAHTNAQRRAVVRASHDGGR